MSSGEAPMGAAKGKQSDTEALCPPPPPPQPSNPPHPHHTPSPPHTTHGQDLCGGLRPTVVGGWGALAQGLGKGGGGGRVYEQGAHMDDLKATNLKATTNFSMAFGTSSTSH